MTNNKCQKHSTEVKKEYTFGKRQDAVVEVYQGCKCATSYAIDQFTTGYGEVRHESYGEAAGRAKMIVAEMNVKFR